MERSVKQLDAMIGKLATETGAAPIRCDPDDPWYSENLIHSTSVSKVCCPKCGYYYTLPFETECPICEYTSGKVHPPKFKLNLDIIRNIIERTGVQKPNAPKPKEGGAAAAAAPAPEKKKKGNPPPKQTTQEELDSCFSHAHFQVARLEKCYKHPNAEKLIVAEAHLDDTTTRVLVTGLIPHYQAEDLEGKLVAVITNLKPKKMVGIEGGVMLLAATNPETGKIQILSLPEGSQVGDRVFPDEFPLLKHIVDKTMTHADSEHLLELYQAGTGEEMPEIPKRQFEKVVAGFKIMGEKPTFYGKPLRTARGYLTAPGIPDGSEFH